MDTYNFLKSLIAARNFKLSAMEQTIERHFCLGSISKEQEIELLSLAAENADDRKEIDIIAVLADFERRLEIIESAGVVVWKPGMSTARGQTVLYDIINDGQMRYCRYDGGRSATSLSPGKIDGWVILASVGGEVTHRVEKDGDGKIILVPVGNE